MNTLTVSAIISFVLGTISFLWLATEFAALTDIWRGIEPNLEDEWWVVKYSFIPLTLFHLSVLTMLLKFFYLRIKNIEL